MKLVFHERAWEDYVHWQQADPKLLQRINALIKEASRTPFTGTGKPEPLRGPLSGWWSRRITKEHRLIYRPTEDGLLSWSPFPGQIGGVAMLDPSPC